MAGADDFEKLMAYQNKLQQSLRRETQIDRKIELLSLINQLTAHPGNIVQKEHVIIEAEDRGFTHSEIDRYLDQLIRDRILVEISPGYIKKP